jgi:hypothetical protein
LFKPKRLPLDLVPICQTKDWYDWIEDGTLTPNVDGDSINVGSGLAKTG